MHLNSIGGKSRQIVECMIDRERGREGEGEGRGREGRYFSGRNARSDCCDVM